MTAASQAERVAKYRAAKARSLAALLSQLLAAKALVEQAQRAGLANVDRKQLEEALGMTP